MPTKMNYPDGVLYAEYPNGQMKRIDEIPTVALDDISEEIDQLTWDKDDFMKFMDWVTSGSSETIYIPMYTKKKFGARNFRKWYLSYPGNTRDEAAYICSIIAGLKGKISYSDIYYDNLFAPHYETIICSIAYKLMVKNTKTTKE